MTWQDKENGLTASEVTRVIERSQATRVPARFASRAEQALRFEFAKFHHRSNMRMRSHLSISCSEFVTAHRNDFERKRRVALFGNGHRMNRW